MEQELDQKIFEKIEAYLLEELSQEEHAAFESRMVEDAVLKQEVEVQRQNMLAVEMGAFSNSLSKIADEYKNAYPAIDRKGGSRGFSIMRVFSIAASIVLLVALSFWFMNRPDKYERIMAEHFVPDAGLPVPMSATDNYEFHDAMVDYKMEKFDKAISKWNALLIDSPQNDTLRYYIASAEFNAGRTEKAIPLYEGLAQDQNSVFQNKAEWYLFLAYLDSEQFDKLHAFSVPQDGSYSDRMREIKALVNEE